MKMKKSRIEFGDFQTPDELAKKVVQLVSTRINKPISIIEPTCGKGSFIKASQQQWGNRPKYFGFDIKSKYVKSLKNQFLKYSNIFIEKADFFKKDWISFFKQQGSQNILVIGNPPWVTNAVLGSLGSNNLPQKSNFQRHGGFAAKTGKANFDIAEWILIKLIESLKIGHLSWIAMLCKTSTARKVLKHFWTTIPCLENSSIHLIDANEYFGVSVDACLFITKINQSNFSNYARVFSNLSFRSQIAHIGMSGKELIANIDDFNRYHSVDGIEYYKWRSGLKHDCSKVMELQNINGSYVNGYGEKIDIEPYFAYPLIKSSDLGNGRNYPRIFVIVTQRNISDDTSEIQYKAPKTWAYLMHHSKALDSRKSIIYSNRPRFSIFGIGEYSFSLWKVAISGLYKNTKFITIGPYKNKPIMFDDTCYFISCNSQAEALFVAEQLNSESAQRFLHSLTFFDAKRPVNIDILRRVDIKKLSEINSCSELALKYLPYSRLDSSQQLSFVFEKDKKSFKKNEVKFF